jgi:pre-mRNA-splicing factor 18
MNFLTAEMERKRKQLQEKQQVGPDKKYFKRGDLMEKERERYLKRNLPKQEDVKDESIQNKDKSDEKSDCEKSSKEDPDLDVPTLPRIEVVRRLRERLQPTILFGETELEA